MPKRKRNRPSLTRSEIMARVRGRDTGPELLVRRMLHAMGYRYRVQARGLPGRPDLAFTKRRVAVFVHGCFWHGHDCARGVRTPKANAEFWRAKIDRNRVRDAASAEKLAALGWRTMVVWECGLRDREALAERLRKFLGPVRSREGKGGISNQVRGDAAWREWVG